MSTLPTIIFGKVQPPVIVDKYIPSTLNSAWDDLGQRNADGMVLHSMVGNLVSTWKWFQNFPGHIAQGLTDFGVGGSSDGALDGAIWQFNDPWGRRSGWASGGSDGLEGDGPAFVRKFGVNGINRNLASIERSDGGNLTQPMSPKQFESVCHLMAWLADKSGIPFYTFPVHPKFGIVMFFGHYEFATKDCPFDWVQSHFPQIIARTVEIMKAAQLVVEPQAPEPEVPVTPDKPQPIPVWPNGWTTEALKKRFGKVPEYDLRKGQEPGPVMRGFSEKGMISNMWVAEAVKESITDIDKIPLMSVIVRSESKDKVESSFALAPRSGHPDWKFFKGEGNATWTRT